MTPDALIEIPAPWTMKKGRIGQWIERQFDKHRSGGYGKTAGPLCSARNAIPDFPDDRNGFCSLSVASCSPARSVFEFMPLMDEGNIKLQAELPQGLQPRADRRSFFSRSKASWVSHPEVKHMLTTLGKNLRYRYRNQPRVRKYQAGRFRTARDDHLGAEQPSSSRSCPLSPTRVSRTQVGPRPAADSGGAPIEFYLKGYGHRRAYPD